MVWKEILTDADIEELMDTCLGFHDACIVSAAYASNTYVDEEGKMYFTEPENFRLNVLFHSQWKIRRFELSFGGVRRVHLVGGQDNHLNIIYGAYLKFHKNILPAKYDMPKRQIVWSDHAEFALNEIDEPFKEPAVSYIIASSLKWRVVESLNAKTSGRM